jgi:hypothetical protein
LGAFVDDGEMATIPSGVNVRAAIVEARLRELYVTQGLTVDQVAATFEVAPSTILRRFKDLGLPTRARGPVPGARRNALARFGRRFEWTADLAYAVVFIDWLRASTRRLAQISGDLGVRRSPAHSDLWRLRYAKRESLALLRWIYYAPDVACLQRKRDRAAPFLVARDVPVGRERPMIV